MMEASPVTESTLFFLEEEPHAAGQAVADLAGTADHFTQSTLTPSTVMPNSLVRAVTVR